MALHPQVKMLLEQVAALGLPDFWALSAHDARAQYAAGRMPTPDEPVARVENLAIPGPHGEISARLYAPEVSPNQPAVVYFHGGGWVIGSVETHDYLCRLIANGAKCTVLSVDYHLAPEHKFPTAADDAYAATTWASRHASELGIDPSRIAVAGDSAGGNLAAVVALMARDLGGPAILHQALIYPVIDFNFKTTSYRDNAEGYLLSTKSMRWFWAHYLASEADGANPYASPLRAESLAGLPPALIVSAEYDPLRDEDKAYAERLRAAGVDVTYAQYEGQVHGFFQMYLLFDDAKAAMAQVCGALRGAFASAPALPRT
jgi:acetyl esterase